jgi:hypothetical protein
MEVREYRQEDYFAIQDAVEPFCTTEGDASLLGNGIAVTAIDGDAMACGGIAYTEEGGIVWVKVSMKCKDKAYAWARTIKEIFNLMIESVDVPVSTYVLKGFCRGDRLARSIGMKKTNEIREVNGNVYYKYTVA